MENRRGRGWLRQTMPNTAAFIDAVRATFCTDPHDAAELDDTIRRGFNGEPGCFHAVEGGVEIGAPVSLDGER